MSAHGKLDYSSGGPDRPLYRSSLAAQMERSSSFRDMMEHPVSASHLNMLRTTSPIAQTDVTNFFHCLRFDPKVVAADHKSIRQGDFKRHVNIALGIQGDESPSTTLKGKSTPSHIPEEIKKLKAGLRENNVKARERVKIFNEASSVFNKFFPSVPTKRRSRPEGFCNDRSGDRLALGPGLVKLGMQGQEPDNFELDQQKLDERPKGGAFNKRFRTSMMDVRSNAIVRQSTAVDTVQGDKDTLRLANHNAVQGESSIGNYGWEKLKMKKKRSGIRTDGSSSLASNKAVDYRDLKQGMPKLSGDSRTRLNGDLNMLRPGAMNVDVPFGRSDNLSQQTGLAVHSLLARDSDHNSLYNEKRERAIGSDKERENLRAVSKSNIHDESNSSSPTSNPRINASVRGPRSGSGLPPKLSPVFHTTSSPSDWDISGCSNKPPLLSGVPNRKRMTSNRSSSPPVTQWASQRPQKISRISRRTNWIPTISSNDNVPSSGNMSDVGYSETGFGFHRRSPAASPQMKLKAENSLSTTPLSGSEESSPPEMKSKDKGMQSDEIEGKTAQSVPKVSVPCLQSRKNKLVSGEELSDGVRRQGRTGRGFASARSVNVMGVIKHGTAKQLRSARNNSDKSESSRAGRPPTRKLSDRKAYKRQKSTATNATKQDLLVGSDDGHEELIAAVNSAVNFARNFPSSFWKQMERYFCYISDAHINLLKQQGELSSMGTTPVKTSSDSDSREIFHEELATSRLDSEAEPLYHRLLSALISEDSTSVNEDLQFDGFGANGESEFSVLNRMEFNGYRRDRLEFGELDDHVSVIPFKGVKSSDPVSGSFSDHLSINFSDIQYETLGIDDKIYIEAQSIGIFLEPMPSILNVEDDGIVDDIKKLEEAICEVGSKKKEMLNRLLKPALEMKQFQEKEFDRLGYEKLIEMAYEKNKPRRHHPAGGKSLANKISKQAAFAFVKRTLERCRQFEETGKSCFSESTLKDILTAGLTQIEDEDVPPASTPIGTEPTLGMTQSTENYAYSSDNALRGGKDETLWSNKMKKRELLLDDVGGAPLSSNTKGKRSERERDGKGHASSSRGGGTNNIGLPALSSAKDERKSKTKPRQKTTLMFSSSSVNILEQPRTSLSKPTNSEYSNLDESEPLDLSHLQIPDGLGGPDDFDTQAGDLSSWLNIDDDALQETDLLGLQIPMDDLSELKMMV